MPHNHEWQSRIKAAEREYMAMRQAADRFRQATQADPTILRDDLRHREIVAASTNLEGTYIIRLFAEFETGARQYWVATQDSRFAGRVGRAMRDPDTERDHAHSVREYRNGLVHEREDDPEVIPMGRARHYLCHFFSYLPREW